MFHHRQRESLASVRQRLSDIMLDVDRIAGAEMAEPGGIATPDFARIYAAHDLLLRVQDTLDALRGASPDPEPEPRRLRVVVELEEAA